MRDHRSTASRSQGGFTLLEVAIALSILAGVLLVLATTTARFIHTVTLDRVRIQANAVANAHIARIQLWPWPIYDSLSVHFAGTTPDYPFTGWSRETTIWPSPVVVPPNDYTRITVSVTAPALDSSVRRTITIAAQP
ncbi:MAG: type II secretion system protein [Gemmatimonadetes bacterium]|nr:type II secretion system protein [Gemmatimonadota bacterium]